MGNVLCVAAVLVAVPLATGGCLGGELRRWRGGRAGNAASILVGMGFLLVAVLVYWRFPIIGIWDAALEFILLCSGMLVAFQRAVASWRDVLLAACALLVSLFLLELACRFVLPAPPVFAITGGAHVFLEDALRADPELQPADTRSKEIVCSVVYGDEYPGVLGLPPDRSLVLPATYRPRPGVTRRVLHLGDSMLFGLGVARDETFTAVLERLEPGVEHINGGIYGTAPDAYLALLRRWLAMHPVDEVIMYPFEGNDVCDVDGPYPCCDWQPLLSYGSDGVSLRCAKPTPPDLHHATWTWLRYNSPPPYLLRVLIGHSAAAAYVSAVLVVTGQASSLITPNTDEARLTHIEAIFRAARAETRARDIPFVVVVLPTRQRLEDPRRSGDGGMAQALVDAAHRAGVPALDASEVVRSGMARGTPLFLGPKEQRNVHFNADGHALVGQWLHSELNAVVAGSLPAPVQ
jgi:hypothetical protein